LIVTENAAIAASTGIVAIWETELRPISLKLLSPKI